MIYREGRKRRKRPEEIWLLVKRKCATSCNKPSIKTASSRTGWWTVWRRWWSRSHELSLRGFRYRIKYPSMYMPELCPTYRLTWRIFCATTRKWVRICENMRQGWCRVRSGVATSHQTLCSSAPLSANTLSCNGTETVGEESCKYHFELICNEL